MKTNKKTPVFRSAILLTVGCALILAAAAVPLCAFSVRERDRSVPAAAQADDLPPVLRLHILANSDSEEDQAVKLRVRDEVLRVTARTLADCRDRDEAAAVIGADPRSLLDAADRVLREAGYAYTSSLTIGPEEYPDRVYGGQVYPAGTYLSVRILLGAGEGHNWWCVLFPSLCLSAAVLDASDAPAAPKADDAVPAGLTPGQYRAITGTENVTGGYVLRWRFWEALKEWIASCK